MTAPDSRRRRHAAYLAEQHGITPEILRDRRALAALLPTPPGHTYESWEDGPMPRERGHP